MPGGEKKLFFIVALLIAVTVVGVTFSTRFFRFPIGYVGLYPYLGEGTGPGDAPDKVFEFAHSRFLKGACMAVALGLPVRTQ